SEDDTALMQRLIDTRMPLTVCPLSNLKLCVVADLAQHNVARLLRAGVNVTINSDDPAYFGGYLADNYLACVKALGLTRDEIVTLAGNSLAASFLPPTDKARLAQDLANAARS
ncbi:MAG: adenosine deaminase, partial [Xanthomonadales bacterium]|nr:adenosine deaminase [Xanthomonadales bacterium]